MEKKTDSQEYPRTQLRLLRKLDYKKKINFGPSILFQLSCDTDFMLHSLYLHQQELHVPWHIKKKKNVDQICIIIKKGSKGLLSSDVPNINEK